MLPDHPEPRRGPDARQIILGERARPMVGAALLPAALYFYRPWLAYLDLCRTFWKMGEEELAA